jgi:hypothetical protein
LDVKLHDRGHGDKAREPMIDALCAVIFNAQGRLLEELLKRDLEEDGPDRLRPSTIDHDGSLKVIRTIPSKDPITGKPVEYAKKAKDPLETAYSRFRSRQETRSGFLEEAFVETMKDWAKRIDYDFMSLGKKRKKAKR